MRQLLKFILVGTLNTAIGYIIIFFCMYWLDISALISNMIGYAIGLIFSYLSHKFFTFNNKSKLMNTAYRFVIVFMVAYLANIGVLFALIHYSNIHEGIAQILAGAIYVVISFLMNKYYVFSLSPVHPCKSIVLED
ncbi:GtrA family protein [soil metagenome]